MKNKNSHEKVNLFFSAFLIIAYIICGYFFVSFAGTQQSITGLIMTIIFAVFGLLLFYATRVGEGKAVKRFSIVTLIVLDIPALFIILAFLIAGFPFHDAIAEAGNGAVALMAAMALGYGVPYTFISGFEMISEDAAEKKDDKADEADEESVLEGGVEADILAAGDDSDAVVEPTYEVEVDEIVVEGTADEE